MMAVGGARIAILDSGINCSHPHIDGMGAVVVGPTIAEDGTVGQDPTADDTLGHGTAVAAAILDLAPGSVLYSIKIFGQSLDCPFDHVLLGLEHALAWGPHLVNLSLGTTLPMYRESLEELLAVSLGRGVRIVAPASMSGLSSYPGSLEGVDSVVEDPDRPRQTPEQRQRGGRDYWFSSPFPRDLPGLPRSANLSGISFATANVTGYLAARRQ